MSKFKDALDRIKTVADLLDDDDPDKREMLDIEGDYSDLMDWAIKKRNECISMANANKELAAIYTARKQRFDNKADSIKEIAGLILDCANETKYSGAFGSVSKKNMPPKPIVTDEAKVPSKYKKEVIDKTAINEAIKNGAKIDGVSMDNGSISIQMRSK